MEEPMNIKPKSETERAKEMEKNGGYHEVGPRSREEEYKVIADLTGFDNLKEMLDAEALWKRNKRKKRKRKKKRHGSCIESQVQGNIPVYNAMDREQASERRAKEAVELLKPESVLTQEDIPKKHLVDNAMDKEQESEGWPMRKIELKTDSAQKPAKDDDEIFVDTAKQKEQPGIIEEVKGALAAGDGVNCAAVMNCTSTSPESVGVNCTAVIDVPASYSADDGMVLNISISKGLAEILQEESITGIEMKKRKKMENVDIAMEENREDSVIGLEMESIEMKDNVVLRQLLRKPRYFDPPSNSWEKCSHSGKEVHMAKQCATMQKQWKPCFICGSFGHTGRRCKLRQFCYACKGRGHRASHRSEKGQENKLSLDICLRCGESGHEMFSCRSNYSPDDLKKIRCYVCKKFGHICCSDFPEVGQTELSCYNCGQSGHLGSGCTSCKKCGEDGHFARTCTKHMKDRQRTGDLITPVQALDNKMRSSKSISASRDLIIKTEK